MVNHHVTIRNNNCDQNATWGILTGFSDVEARTVYGYIGAGGSQIVGQVFAQDSAAVERGKRLFERLDAVALDEEQSRRKLAEYVSGLREDSNGPGTDLA